MLQQEREVKMQEQLCMCGTQGGCMRLSDNNLLVVPLLSSGDVCDGCEQAQLCQQRQHAAVDVEAE